MQLYIHLFIQLQLIHFARGYYGGWLGLELIPPPKDLSNIVDVASTNGAFAGLDTNGRVITWGDATKGGDSYDIAFQLVNVKKLFSNLHSFVALKEDGSYVCWGDRQRGGDCSTVQEELNDVKEIINGPNTFFALRNDGSLISWGHFSDLIPKEDVMSEVEGVYSSENSAFILKTNSESSFCVGTSTTGGNCENVDFSGTIKGVSFTYSSIAVWKEDGTAQVWGSTSTGGNTNGADLTNIKQIYATGWAFAALKYDGSVISWGNSGNGGDSSHIASELSANVTTISSNRYAFAAIKKDGSVVCWGDSRRGGNLPSSLNGFKDVDVIYSTSYAFAMLSKTERKVITWGDPYYGGNSNGVADQLFNVTNIYVSHNAYAALKDDGTVVTWGSVFNGGDSSLVVDQLTDIVDIYSTLGAFVARKTNGDLVAWGSPNEGGETEIVSPQLFEKANAIYHDNEAIVVLSNGGVFTWGLAEAGGDISHLGSQLSKDVKAIFPGYNEYAAIKTDGSAVTWPSGNVPGDSSAVQQQLSSDVEKVYWVEDYGAALKTNGTVIFWGDDDNIAQEENVIEVFAAEESYALLKEDGSLVTRFIGMGEFEQDLSANVTGVMALAASFVAFKSDRSIIVFGDIEGKVLNVNKVAPNEYFDAVCALTIEGSVQCLGSKHMVPNAEVQSILNANVTDIVGTANGFLALKSDNSIVNWGRGSSINDETAERLRNGTIKYIDSSGIGALAYMENGEILPVLFDNDIQEQLMLKLQGKIHKKTVSLDNAIAVVFMDDSVVYAKYRMISTFSLCPDCDIVVAGRYLRVLDNSEVDGTKSPTTVDEENEDSSNGAGGKLMLCQWLHVVFGVALSVSVQ